MKKRLVPAAPKATYKTKTRQNSILPYYTVVCVVACGVSLLRVLWHVCACFLVLQPGQSGVGLGISPHSTLGPASPSDRETTVVVTASSIGSVGESDVRVSLRAALASEAAVAPIIVSLCDAPPPSSVTVRCPETRFAPNAPFTARQAESARRTAAQR